MGYTSYFGFTEEPFSLTPASRLFYTTPVYEAAYEKLLDGIYKRRGLMVLTGEVGTGKTTLLRRLMDALSEDPSVHLLSLYYSAVSAQELLSFMCEDLGLAKVQETDASDRQILDELLQERTRAKETVVLFLDEAQEVTAEALLALQGFFSASAASGRLLQVVLVGQHPELENKLNRRSFLHFKRNIAVRCQLEHLGNEEVLAFIHHRLRLVGCQREDLFSSEALRLITYYSQGIPRVINLVCDNALRETWKAEQETVSAAVIQKVARTLLLTEESHFRREESSDERSSPRWSESPSFREFSPAFSQYPAAFTGGRWGGIVGIALISWWKKWKALFQSGLVWSDGLGVFVVLVAALLFFESSPDTPKTLTMSPPPFNARTLETNLHAARGKEIVDHLSARPLAWGLATAKTALALLVPEEEWNILSKDEQIALTLYIEALIPIARANPDPYVKEFRTAALYENFRAKVANLCADCWVIGVTPPQGHESDFLDKIVVQGDSLWETFPEQDRGVKASEFRAAR